MAVDKPAFERCTVALPASGQTRSRSGRESRFRSSTRDRTGGVDPGRPSRKGSWVLEKKEVIIQSTTNKTKSTKSDWLNHRKW